MAHDANQTCARREDLKKYGTGLAAWNKKVNLMPPDQVDAIWLRWEKAGRFNRKK